MTNQQHPITPPTELRRLWAQQAQRLDPYDPVAWMEHVSTQSARWGADMELEACCEVLAHELLFDGKQVAADLRDARRHQPPSLADEALGLLVGGPVSELLDNEVAIIRRALERLQELEGAR